MAEELARTSESDVIDDRWRCAWCDRLMADDWSYARGDYVCGACYRAWDREQALLYPDIIDVLGV